MEAYLCVRCGTQYPPSDAPPDGCPICLDEREAVRQGGQRWTTLDALRRDHRTLLVPVEAGVAAVATDPPFAIGQRGYLIRTPRGNILWDCPGLIDDAAIAAIAAQGGLAAIAISHPHFHGAMVEWARAFAVPVFIHADNRPWVLRDDGAIRYWEGERQNLLPGVTLVRCGGHFPGSAVLHWADGADGNGALFTGDTIGVVEDRRWVTFMYSYVNLIPLGAAAIRRIAAAVEPLAFDRLYGGWDGQVVAPDAAGAVQRSAARHLRHLATG